MHANDPMYINHIRNVALEDSIESTIAEEFHSNHLKPMREAIGQSTSFGIKPTGDLVIIRKHSTENLKTASGILLPPVEESADTPWKGTVLAVGPGKPCKLSPSGENVVTALQSLLDSLRPLAQDRVIGEGLIEHCNHAYRILRTHESASPRMPMQVKVGDTVIFSRNGYQEFKINGQLVFAMGESSILGIIEE